MERVAYIEVNNFMAKLIIAESKTNAFFNILAKRVVPVDLGKDLEKDHFLKRGQIDDCIEVLKQFRKTCDMYKVDHTSAIATFLNENRPKNVISFFDEVYIRCGFRVSVIDNLAQNNDLFVAIQNSIDGAKNLICQIDFDSIRLLQTNRRNILNSVVYPFGPLSLLSLFPEEQYTSAEERYNAIKEYITTEVDAINFSGDLKGVQFVGVGRYFDDLAKMIRKYRKYPFEISHGYNMEIADIDYIFSQIEPMGLDKEKKIKGLEEGRIDTFLLSLFMIKEIMRKFEMTQAIFSRNGILEGAILNDSLEPTPEKPVLDMVDLSLAGCTIGYTEQQLAHSRQVMGLAVNLFKELRVLHKLNKGYLKILKVAAFLHDVGYNVDYFKHSAHSSYIMRSKGINGLTHREQILAGFVASIHHGEELNLSDWLKYSSLYIEGDADAVQKLGVILQIAEGLDISMQSVITEVNCDILGDSVIFKTEANEDKSYEVQEAGLASKKFEKFFKKRMEIL